MIRGEKRPYIDVTWRLEEAERELAALRDQLLAAGERPARGERVGGMRGRPMQQRQNQCYDEQGQDA